MQADVQSPVQLATRHIANKYITGNSFNIYNKRRKKKYTAKTITFYTNWKKKHFTKAYQRLVNYINSLQADAKHSNRSKFNREKLENITKALRRSRKSQKKSWTANSVIAKLLPYKHTQRRREIASKEVKILHKIQYIKPNCDPTETDIHKYTWKVQEWENKVKISAKETKNYWYTQNPVKIKK